MSEWKTVLLGEKCSIKTGKKDVNEGNPSGHFPFFTCSRKISFSDSFSFDTEAILIAGNGDVGNLHYYIGKFEAYQRTYVLNQFKVNVHYIYQSLAFGLLKILSREKIGTSIPYIKLEHLSEFPLSLPVCRLEQQKIATILQTIDQTIEKTEALIKKYQQIKAGLMHDLFTRGITADGKLRPPREQAPELYQETLIGWIPKDWRVATLKSLLAPLPHNMRSGPFGSALLKHELVEDGIPFLGIDNIHIESFVSIYRRYISVKKYNELLKYSVRPKDVVITIMGTVGRCTVIPDDIGQALSSKHLWTMTLDQEKVFPELVCWQLNYASWVKAWFRRETQGGIMDAIQSKTLKTLLLPVPLQNEQELIFNKYITINSRIDFERKSLEKLNKQKQGLMQDLLTGKVPVKVDNPEASHA